MHTPIKYNYSYTHRRLSTSRPLAVPPLHHLDHKKRVKQELKNLGVSWFGANTMEAKYLPKIIHPNERIGGLVYGHHADGFVMLVATDRRIIFLDIKPLIENEDEVTYDVVSGVSFGHAGFKATVTLHTRVKDYPIRTYNQKCARKFVEYIEARSLEHKNGKENSYD